MAAAAVQAARGGFGGALSAMAVQAAGVNRKSECRNPRHIEIRNTKASGKELFACDPNCLPVISGRGTLTNKFGLCKENCFGGITFQSPHPGGTPKGGWLMKVLGLCLFVLLSAAPFLAAQPGPAPDKEYEKKIKALQDQIDELRKQQDALLKEQERR
jgi:hypothetical protein